MIVVISDLHFEEEASDIIRGRDGRQLIFRRNLDADAYRAFISAVAEEARERKVRELHFVIAGDVFDFNRTAIWLRDELRPYVALDQIAGPLEAKILVILNATAAEKPVAEALKSFQLLCRGKYIQHGGDEEGKETDFPVSDLHVHCLAGNHDRVANATPKIRGRVRELLGLDGDARFEHTLRFNDPRVLIRHGHEYDPDNFGADFSGPDSIPFEVPEASYSAATFGDFITIDVATRLPHLLRKHYGDEEILDNSVLSTLYLRLLQFDDVRPQSALFDYLLDDSPAGYDAEAAWERLVPIVDRLMDEIHDDPFFRHWLRERVKPWSPAEIEAARGLLKLGGWKNRLAREAARRLAHYFMGGEPAKPELFAAREELIRNRDIRLVLAGHTHTPEVELVAADAESDRYYINTGTWRNRIPSTPDRRNFGRLKALTYVMLFKGDEEEEPRPGEIASFDYWTGLTRTW